MDETESDWSCWESTFRLADFQPGEFSVPALTAAPRRSRNSINKSFLLWRYSCNKRGSASHLSVCLFHVSPNFCYLQTKRFHFFFPREP